MRINGIPYYSGVRAGAGDDKPLREPPLSKRELREKELDEITCAICETPEAECNGNCQRVIDGKKLLRKVTK